MLTDILLHLIENWIAVLSLVVAFSSLVVSWRYPSRARKKEMIDRVYGPLLREFNVILQSVKDYDYEIRNKVEDLREIMSDFLFFKLENKLRNRIESFKTKLETYEIVHRVVKGIIEETIRMALPEISKNESDTFGTVVFKLVVGNYLLNEVRLEEAILKEKTPRQILSERFKFREEQLQIYLPSGRIGEDKHRIVDDVCKRLLEIVKEDGTVRNMRERNQTILEDASQIIDELGKYI